MALSMVVVLALVVLDRPCLGTDPLMRVVDIMVDTIRSIDIMRDGIIGIRRGHRIIRIGRGGRVRRRVIVVMMRGGMGVATTDTTYLGSNWFSC